MVGSILMTNNNNKHQYPRIRFIVLLLLAVSASTIPTRHSNQIEDLQNFTMHHQEQSYHLLLNINHHPIKLMAHLQNGRTWIKEALCKVCQLESEECTSSCFSDKQSVKISCDSSFCSEMGDFNDETRGIAGKQGEVFLKIGENTQILMPLIMANKLYQNHSQFGIFNLFDGQSSFSNAIISKSPLGSIEVYNINKLSPEDYLKYTQQEGKPLKINMAGDEFNFDFLRSKKIALHHIEDDQRYPDFNDDTTEYEIDFSLQSFSIEMPIKLAKKLEKHLNETYLIGKKCRLLPKKLKCIGEIESSELFKTLFHFQLNEYQLAIPMHMLFTACSKNQCNTLINFDQSSERKITFGYIIWQLYNLEYSLDKKLAIFHRRTTQWDDLFLKDKVNLSKVSFSYGLFLIIYHTFKYVLIVILCLAVLSLIVNFFIHWRSVLRWVRGLLSKRQRSRRAFHQCQEDEFYDQRPIRKINKLRNPFEDSETI